MEHVIQLGINLDDDAEEPRGVLPAEVAGVRRPTQEGDGRGMSQSKWVRVGSVRRFDHVEADKAQALKPLEEAAEVVEAWKDWDAFAAHGEAEQALLAECADVIQATLNLVAALGVEDFRPYMKECERRNRERGRISDGKAADE